MMIKERIRQLKALMAERHMDAYLIPTADFHESEYVGEHFKCRQFMTGFTGSAGTAVVTAKEAVLWVDGRYYVQASNQLKGSGIQMFRMGQEGVPTLEEFLMEKIPEGGVLGFDGRVVNEQLGTSLKNLLKEKNATVSYKEDLVGMIWEERPPMSREPVWILKENYAGKGAGEKISDLRNAMKKAKASVHVLTTLDDIAWLLNIRGNDIPGNPVVLSYLMLTEEKLYLFIHKETLNEETKAYLADLGVSVKPYDAVYEYVKSIRDETVLLESSRTNYAIFHLLDSSNRIVDAMNPTALAKAVKNPVEIENMKRAHIKDGVAVTKFIYWLKSNIGQIPMDEMSVAEHLEGLRKQQKGYIEPSFSTISAYGSNAAMCHYRATEETNRKLEPRGLYLVDSGGQYFEGTTDITRTIALGELTKDEREHFTLTVMAMLRLGSVKFLYGCRGMNLDYAAREVLWSRGLNFDHGTGHGVSYLLNVHERPHGIRWKVVPERQDSGVLEAGMVTSDEPGVYIEGSHGIRTENLLLCKEAEKNLYGQFMEFEYLTFAPIDLDAIDVSIMEDKDVERLNQYHQAVYEKLAPYLEEKERVWLKAYTRAIPPYRPVKN